MKIAAREQASFGMQRTGMFANAGKLLSPRQSFRIADATNPSWRGSDAFYAPQGALQPGAEDRQRRMLALLPSL